MSDIWLNEFFVEYFMSLLFFLMDRFWFEVFFVSVVVVLFIRLFIVFSLLVVKLGWFLLEFGFRVLCLILEVFNLICFCLDVFIL